MKPPAFAYVRAEDLEQCLEILGQLGDGTLVLAGGQSLVPLLNMRLARPTTVVDVNALTSLDFVEATPDGVRIGALTRAARAERDPGLAGSVPVLVSALRHVGHPQTRSRTTIGGSVAHADPASELPAVLAALDGRVELASATASRSLPWDEFFLAPYWTARRPDELVVGISLGAPAGYRWSFLEVARRHGDFAIVGACVGLRIGDDEVLGARVALCGVGSVPMRRPVAEDALSGPLPLGPRLAEVEAVVGDGLESFGDIHAPAAYRRAVSGVLVRRAAEAIEREWQGATRDLGGGS